MHGCAPVPIMIPDTRQHGCVSQGVQRRKVARTDARAFSISGAPPRALTHPRIIADRPEPLTYR